VCEKWGKLHIARHGNMVSFTIVVPYSHLQFCNLFFIDKLFQKSDYHICFLCSILI